MVDHIGTLRAFQAWRRGEDERTLDEAGINPTLIDHFLPLTKASEVSA